MTCGTSFLNDIKIETVNAKFATSILNETSTKLALSQCSKRGRSQRHDELEATTKFMTDLTNIRQTLNKVINDLREHLNFTDFSGFAAAENESTFLMEYTSNRAMLEEQTAAIQELEKVAANCRTPIDTVDESILKCAIHNRFIKTWEQARRHQNDHYNRMIIDSLQNEIDTYARNIENEKRCMREIRTYSLSEMEMHKAECIKWSEKFDADLNRTEIDIQVATVDLERTKMNYAKTVETIKIRVQQMIDFVALKEERAAQKDSAAMKLIDQHREHLFAKSLCVSQQGVPAELLSVDCFAKSVKKITRFVKI